MERESFWGIASVLLLATLFHYLASSYYKAGLNRYPGPLLAKFTKLWHWLNVQTGKHYERLLKLHRDYGDVVRIGPNEISIGRPDYVSRIYGVSPGYLKSDMYDAFGPRINGKRAISWLSAREPGDHVTIKKPIAGAYTLSVVSEYEPLVDEVIKNFMRRLDSSFVVPKRSCDMALWTRFYAYDVITHLTFGESLGFLDQGIDIGNFLQESDGNLDLTGLLSTMPWTAILFKYNPVIGYFAKSNTVFPDFCLQQIKKRIAEREGQKAGQKLPSIRTRDFLDRFIDAARIDKPPGYDLRLLMEWTLVNIMAGADTTAISLTAILYYLLQAPAKMRKLMEELKAANLSYPVSWKECQDLPYLDACIKEAYRLHPVIGLGLGRVASGLKMPDGFVLQDGTTASMNAYVIQRQTLFGDDVDSFIPERWLCQANESVESYQERMNLWKRSDMFFGGNGHRSCTGRHIALLETYKVIPTLLLKFEMKLEFPSEEWKIFGRWTVRPESLPCTMKFR